MAAHAKKNRQPGKRGGKQPAPSGAAGPDALAVEIGKRLVEAREGLELSQEGVSGQSKRVDPAGEGISRSTLSLYETGVNKPGARELVILCETLKVTPNWLLYGSDSPAKTLQASLEFLRGSDVDVAPRLAMAILALEPEERDSFASLIFASLQKKYGDLGLSGLLSAGALMRDSLVAEIVNTVGEKNRDRPLHELVPLFIKEWSGDGKLITNYGTLRPPVKEDERGDVDPDKPSPPRRLSQKK